MMAQRRIGAMAAGVGVVAPVANTETSLTEVSAEQAVAATKAAVLGNLGQQ